MSKYRLLVWSDVRICPDKQLVVIDRDDDTSFGILQIRFHELWSLRLCTGLGKGNDPGYTPTTTFETFPFPAGLAPNVPATSYAADARAIASAEASRRLVELRERWLKPPEWVEWVEWVEEAAPGDPERAVPRDEESRKETQKTDADEPLQ